MCCKIKQLIMLIALLVGFPAFGADPSDNNVFDSSQCTYLYQNQYYRVKAHRDVCFGVPNLSAKIINADENNNTYLVSNVDQSDSAVVFPGDVIKAAHYFKIQSPEDSIVTRIDDVIIFIDAEQFPDGVFEPVPPRRRGKRSASIPPYAAAATGGGASAVADTGVTPQNVVNGAIGGIVGTGVGAATMAVTGNPYAAAAAGGYVGSKFTKALNKATASSRLGPSAGMKALGTIRSGSCSAGCHG
ncbi:hypothetical protein [Vibrio sp. ER1A]|uniref:hypothetical protein n=1 Tax=Vibrio sp. ER1A TaxID=1517681 RepID=UPI0004DD2754|nr:hypothetical protein [Vibrio sp. ER1A]KFA99518.1 hypothetical protein HW45_03295 [Vibrio sp. ER1A]